MTTGQAASGSKQSSQALIGAAVVYLVPGLLFWPVDGFKGDINDWLRIGGFALLIAMGIWARWSALLPAVISLVLYGILIGLQLPIVPKWPPIVWILHGSILLLLLVALVAAIRSRGGRTKES